MPYLTDERRSIVSRALFHITIGLVFLAAPAFAIEFKCEGQEKGINSMTGKERVVPVTYLVEIIDEHATLDGLDNVLFNVNENDDAYILKAKIGESRLLGEFGLQIDKKTGDFKGESWLFSRDNIVTREGHCERIDSR